MVNIWGVTLNTIIVILHNNFEFPLFRVFYLQMLEFEVLDVPNGLRLTGCSYFVF